MGAALKIASGVLQGIVQAKQLRADRRDREEEKQRRDRDEKHRNVRLLAELADDERFIVGGEPAEDPADDPAYTAAPNDSDELRRTMQGDPTRAPAAPARAGRTPLEVARLMIEGREVPVHFDPARSKKARKEAVNRQAHARLRQLDDAVWGEEFDPDFDYQGIEREERSKKQIEDGLVATGMPRDRASFLARNNVDIEKHQRDRRVEADRSADRSERRARQQREAMEREAYGVATSLVVRGRGAKKSDDVLVTDVADGLKEHYPQLTFGQRIGIAARAVLEGQPRTRAAAGGTSGTTVRLPSGEVIDVSAVMDGEATARVNRAAPNQRKRERLRAIDRMIMQGKTDAEIQAELLRLGLGPDQDPD
jgi:hypothetical protein